MWGVPREVSSLKEERPGLTVRWGLLTQSPPPGNRGD